MKTPIKPEDIRKGDLIRYEYIGREMAVEYRASSDGRTWASDGFHYLLDRPAPKVELPDTPTLGWARRSEQVVLGKWHKVAGATFYDTLSHDQWAQAAVEEFTEAVAVPKAALDELRRISALAYQQDRVLRYATREMAINEFLAAVDEANGGDS